MISSLSTAIAGIKDAAANADLAARKIVNAGLAAGATDASPAVIDATGTRPRDDLLRSVLDFQRAALAYRANAKVAAAAGDMEKTLLEALR